MSDIQAETDLFFVREKMVSQEPPPASNIGVVGWLRTNLFATVSDTIMTILAVALIAWIVPPIINWAFVHAQWTGSDRTACAANTTGRLLGLCEGQFRPVHLWPLSAGRALARRPVLHPAGRRHHPDGHPVAALQAPEHALPDDRHAGDQLPAPVRRHSRRHRGRYPALGRPDADHRRVDRRHGRLAALRHIARARHGARRCRRFALSASRSSRSGAACR